MLLLAAAVVALHFVLAMTLLACATFTWHRARWHGGAGERPSGASRAVAWALVAATAVLIVAGTLVTGSGPHAGDSSDVPRMGFDWTVVVWVHAAAAGLVLVLATVLAFRLRTEHGGRLALGRVGIFLLVLLVQLAIGVVQSLIGLPEVLVIGHARQRSGKARPGRRCGGRLHPKRADRRRTGNAVQLPAPCGSACHPVA